MNKDRIVRAGGHVQLSNLLFSSGNHSLQINIIQVVMMMMMMMIIMMQFATTPTPKEGA